MKLNKISALLLGAMVNLHHALILMIRILNQVKLLVDRVQETTDALV